MGVIFACELCGGQAGEFDKVDEDFICGDCQNKALRLGIKMIKDANQVEGEQ